MSAINFKANSVLIDYVKNPRDTAHIDHEGEVTDAENFCENIVGGSMLQIRDQFLLSFYSGKMKL